MENSNSSDCLVLVFCATSPILIAVLLVVLQISRTNNERRKNKKFSVVVEGIEAHKEGHGPIHRSALYPDKLLTLVEGQPEVVTMYHNFQQGVKTAGDGPCLGFRPIVNDVAGPYQWYSYSEVSEKAAAFGAGLLKEKLLPTVDTFRPLALFCKNRPEWVIAEQGLYMYSGSTVPMYDTLGVETAIHVLNQTQPAAVLTTEAETLQLLQWMKEKCRSVKAVIQCTPITDAVRQKCAEAKLVIYDFEQILDIGRKNPTKLEIPSPDSIATFCYTSGTTGLGKGAMLSHRGFVATVAGAKAHGIKVCKGDTFLSYLPLAHVYERYVMGVMLNQGAAIGFYQGNVLKITEDLAALRPHIFISVPRLLNRVYDKVMAGAAESPIKKMLFNAGLEAKAAGRANGTVSHFFWDNLVFNKVARRLGLDRCRIMISGSAPLAPHVMDFFRSVVSIVVLEGYGLTETTACTTIGSLDDLTSGHIGPPTPAVEMKLVAVEDMNYLPTDTMHGDMPCAGRGELYIRGACVMMGYYKMPKETSEALGQDGWLATGDIGVWLPNGNMKIVDRKKNMFKLSQGEYVVPDKIETVYTQDNFIAQAFVYGDSFQSEVVAVFVPDKEYAKKWIKETGSKVTLDGITKDDQFIKAVKTSIDATGKAGNLKGFEKVKQFVLIPEPFTVENNLLTPTFKLKRNEAKAMFLTEIQNMYSKIGGAMVTSK